MSIALLSRRQAGNLIIEKSRIMILERASDNRDVFLIHIRFIEANTQLIVCFNNITEFVRQIVLAALTVLFNNRRTHRRRWHWNNRRDEPLGAVPLWIKSEHFHFILGNSLKNHQYVFRCKFFTNRFSTHVLPISINLERALLHITGRLFRTTSRSTVVTATFDFGSIIAKLEHHFPTVL